MSMAFTESRFVANGKGARATPGPGTYEPARAPFKRKPQPPSSAPNAVAAQPPVRPTASSRATAIRATISVQGRPIHGPPTYSNLLGEAGAPAAEHLAAEQRQGSEVLEGVTLDCHGRLATHKSQRVRRCKPHRTLFSPLSVAPSHAVASVHGLRFTRCALAHWQVEHREPPTLRYVDAKTSMRAKVVQALARAPEDRQRLLVLKVAPITLPHMSPD